MQIPLCYNPSETPQLPGGFADIWVGQYDGKTVAAKALRVYLSSDFNVIRKVCRLTFVVFINKLTASCAAILQGGYDLEDTPSSECIAIGRRDDEQQSVRNGVRVDEQREHRPVPGE